MAAAIKGKVLRVWRKPIPDVAADLGDLGDLDEGETDCIRIALSEGATNAILLTDERAGRAIAHEHGIQVAGTAAVIGFARKHGLIESARASFERLHASDFRISAEVIQTVLRRVGEL